MKKAIIYILIFFSLSCSTNDEDLNMDINFEGVVLNYKTNEPINDVNVGIVIGEINNEIEFDSTNNFVWYENPILDAETNTDENGNFILKLDYKNEKYYEYYLESQNFLKVKDVTPFVLSREIEFGENDYDIVDTLKMGSRSIVNIIIKPIMDSLFFYNLSGYKEDGTYTGEEQLHWRSLRYNHYEIKSKFDSITNFSIDFIAESCDKANLIWGTYLEEDNELKYDTLGIETIDIEKFKIINVEILK